MIIETRDDVVRLSGSMRKNQWLTIKAAANLLLQAHPEGIIIDASQLEDVTEEGSKTFLEAIRDIEMARSRIVVAALPEALLSRCRSLPGLRSQLSIADTVEGARASLRMRGSAPAGPAPAAARRGGLILVPLLASLDLTYGGDLAARLCRPGKDCVQLAFFLEVARTLPIQAPLPDEERSASEALDRAAQLARHRGIEPQTRVERVREAADAIVALARNEGIDTVVIGAAGASSSVESRERLQRLVQTLLERLPCELILGRGRPVDGP